MFPLWCLVSTTRPESSADEITSDSVPTSTSIWVSGFVQHAVVEYRLPALRNFTPQPTICSRRTVDVTPDDEGYLHSPILGLVCPSMEVNVASEKTHGYSILRAK